MALHKITATGRVYVWKGGKFIKLERTGGLAIRKAKK
jgi:hypothetical protein